MLNLLARRACATGKIVPSKDDEDLRKTQKTNSLVFVVCLLGCLLGGCLFCPRGGKRREPAPRYRRLFNPRIEGPMCPSSTHPHSASVHRSLCMDVGHPQPDCTSSSMHRQPSTTSSNSGLLRRLSLTAMHPTRRSGPSIQPHEHEEKRTTASLEDLFAVGRWHTLAGDLASAT